MASGLVSIGSKRILPAPRDNVMRFAGMSAGGGDPGGGLAPGGEVLVTELYPNTDGVACYSWQDGAGSGWPIDSYNIPGGEFGLNEGDRDTISTADANYLEVVTYNNGNCDGFRIEYDTSAFDFNNLASMGQGYGWRTSDSAYGFKTCHWDFITEQYDVTDYHTYDYRYGGARGLVPYTDYVDGDGLVSHLLQGIDPFNDNDQEAIMRHYYSYLYLWKS